MNGVRKIASGAVLLGGSARPLDRQRGDMEVSPASATGAEDIYKQAYLDGFSAGEEDGRKVAQQQASESFARLEQALADAELAKQRWRDGLRDAIEQFAHGTSLQVSAVERMAAEVAELAVRRIVGSLHAEHRAVEAACLETLRALRVESAHVRVSPADIQAFADLPPGVEVIADASLEPGACLLRTAEGDIDASLDTQLGRLHEALQTTRTEAQA